MKKSMKNVNFYLKSILISIILTGCVSIDESNDNSDFFTLEGGTFPGEIDVLITSDTEAAAQYVRDNLDSTVTACDFDGAAGLTFSSQNNKPPIIWLSKAGFDPEDIAIANHELMHATANTMQYFGVLFSDSSEEAYAYQLQYYSNQFYNKLKQ